MINNFISIKQILDKLYRDLGINDELNEDSVIEWIAESLLFIGAFGQYEVINTDLKIFDHRGKLPYGFIKLTEAPRFENIPLHYSGNSLTGSFWCDSCKIPTCCTQYNFYINDNFFNTSLKEGIICLSYMGIPIDDEGFPKIPDDIYYIQACTAYVIKMLDWQKWRRGLIPDKIWETSEANWNFYVQSARGAANMPSIDQLESLKNRLIRIIPQMNEYSNGFKNNPERRFIQ